MIVLEIVIYYFIYYLFIYLLFYLFCTAFFQLQDMMHFTMKSSEHITGQVFDP